MKTNLMTLPCGCEIWNENDAFFIKACPLGTECKYVKYAMETSAQMHKPVEVRHL